MKDVFVKLGTDFLSTIVFVALYLITGNVVLATCVAIAGRSSGPHHAATPSAVVSASNTIDGRAAIRRTRVMLVMRQASRTGEYQPPSGRE